MLFPIDRLKEFTAFRQISISVFFTLTSFLLNAQDSLNEHTFSANEMGTTFNIIIFHEDSIFAKIAAESAFNRIEELNHIFSNYLLDSEAIQLNQVPQKVTNEMWYLLHLSKDLYYQSSGSFDVTIGSVSKLWRKAMRRDEIPDKRDVVEAKKSVGMEKLKFSPETKEVSFSREGMILDFGGIAKGYAVDEAYSTLIENGIKYTLVDGGGDIYAGNHPHEGWKINLMGVDSTIILKNSAIASSGAIYQNLKLNGDDFSHIIDPQTSIGLKNSETINVVGPSCVIADALATILSIDNKNDILNKHYSDYQKL